MRSVGAEGRGGMADSRSCIGSSLLTILSRAVGSPRFFLVGCGESPSLSAAYRTPRQAKLDPPFRLWRRARSRRVTIAAGTPDER